MTKKLINLTLPVVIDNVEKILKTYPIHPYQQAFSDANLYQNLVAYVLNRVSNKFAVLEEEDLSKSILLLFYPSTELSNIESHIHLGIRGYLYSLNRSQSNLSQLYSLIYTTPFIEN